MALMRGFSKVDEDGRIAIPKNIRREAGFEEGQVVEIKLQGPDIAQYITVKRRKAVR